MKYIVRFFEAMSRYSNAIINLNIINTISLILARIFPNDRTSKMATKKFGNIFWRRRGDWVVSHLYTPQIFIDTGEDVVRTIFDVGANIGIVSVRFCKLYPQAKIYAIEADRENFKILNLNSTDRNSIVTVNKGLWNTVAKLKVEKRGADNQGFVVSEVSSDSKDFNIEAITMNLLIEEFKIGEIDLLKIDIEGAESKVFDETCDSWIHLVRCFIIECPDNDAPYTAQKIFNSLLRNNIKVNTYINGENLILVKAGLRWFPESVVYYK